MHLSLLSNIFCARNDHMEHLSTTKSMNGRFYINTFEKAYVLNKIKCLVVSPEEVELLKTIVNDELMDLLTFISNTNDLTEDNYSSFLFSGKAFKYFVNLIPKEKRSSNSFRFLHSHNDIDLNLLGDLNGKMYLEYRSCEKADQINKGFDHSKIKGLTFEQIEISFSNERSANQLHVNQIDHLIGEFEKKLEKLEILERVVSSDGKYKAPERRYINKEIETLKKQKKMILSIERSKTLYLT